MAADFDNSKTLLLGASGFGDRSNPLANPAAMVERDFFQLSLSSYHRPSHWPGGQYLGIVAPIKSRLTDKAMSAGIFGDWAGDNTGLNPEHDFQGLERTYQLGYAFRMPSYLPLSHQLALGINGYWHQFGRNPVARERNWGLDAGLHWNPWYSSRKGELYLDAALLNLLSPYGVDAVDGKRRRALPLDLNASALWRSPMRDLDVYAGLLVEDIDEEFGAGPGYHPGGGLTWHPVRDWELELSYNPLGFPQVGGAWRFFKDGQMRILDISSRLSYGMIQIALVGSLFTRKDQWVFPMRYRRLKFEPEFELHHFGQGEPHRLFQAGRYYLAAYAYGRQLRRFPKHIHVDSTAFTLGLCFQTLGLYSPARDIYEANLRKYSDGNHTRMISDNMLELIRLDYLEGRYDSALARDSSFRELFPESPFLSTLDYLKAQIHFSRGDFSEAIPLYARIPIGHEYHGQARHNLAVSYVQINEVAKAMEVFADLIESPSIDQSELDIRESAMTKAGMLLFQLKDHRADALLSEIGPRSAYRDEAVVVRAWLAVRRGDFRQVESLASAVMESLPRSVLAKEACFLRAYAAFRSGRDKEALDFSDSVIAGDWTRFYLPEEMAEIEKSKADSADFLALQKEFYQESTGQSTRRGCGRGFPRDSLETLRRRHFLVGRYSRRMEKAGRYATSREHVGGLATRMREMLRKKAEDGTLIR